MKKRFTTWMTIGVLSACAIFMTGCGAKTPESVALTTGAVMLANAGDTYDLATAIVVEPADAEAAFAYASSDIAVAEVSADGVITAVGEGTATISVTLEDKSENVALSMDVAVYDYIAAYSATKHIDAMGCDVSVDITLNEGGTYSFYRAPMNIAMSGGGEMPGLEDAGTYTMNGAEIVFTSEVLGEFTVTLSMENGSAVLSGKIPTGGPSTDMVLNQVKGE